MVRKMKKELTLKPSPSVGCVKRDQRELNHTSEVHLEKQNKPHILRIGMADPARIGLRVFYSTTPVAHLSNVAN